MLPALSTVSTRDELKLSPGGSRPAAASLPIGPASATRRGHGWITIAVSFAGFLEALVRHLHELLEKLLFPVIACAHAAGYAIDLQARQPETFRRLVLIAPTWRGRLPTMMSGRKPIQARIRQLIHAPVIGELIYRLHVSRPVVRVMYRRHGRRPAQPRDTADHRVFVSSREAVRKRVVSAVTRAPRPAAGAPRPRFDLSAPAGWISASVLMLTCRRGP